MCLPIKPYKIEREWKHRSLSCAVVMAREAGNRCGYVRVPPGHPYHGEDYDNAIGVRVHGGLTFAELEPCTEHEDGQGWWFGFDCAHAGDAMYDPHPDFATLSEATKDVVMAMRRIHEQVSMEVHGKVMPSEDHYWTQQEVEKECEKLARQLTTRK